MKEKYVVQQVAETASRHYYRISYYRNDRYERFINYNTDEFVEMLCQRFKKSNPKGEIIFLKDSNMPHPEEFRKLEERVKEWNTRH